MSHQYLSDPLLIVDDEELTRRSVSAALLMDGITNVEECEDGREALSLVASKSYSVILLDLAMPNMSGEELLGHILEERPGTLVIVVTATTDLETAVRCMREGAFDYLTKPVDRPRLLASVGHAIERWETAREMSSLKRSFLSSRIETPEAFKAIMTSDQQMLQIFRYVEAISPTPLPVLINGETGVGKELLAQAIHMLSGRRGRFVTVNIAGLDDTLFADTLFGHEKGAYTGADSYREGFVAKADDGTLFLDEIGDLAPNSQIKLLRLLQEHEYYMLGSDSPRPSNARFIFASNSDIAAKSAQGSFRKDLLYRLQSHTIHVPPLRERMDDLPLLVDHFFEKACKTLDKKRPTVPKELVPLLRSYSFPGNIRELEGMIYDAVVRHTSRILSLESFRRALGHAEEARDDDANDSVIDGNLFKSLDALPTLKLAADSLIEEALRRSQGNMESAARMVGLSRSALSKRLSRNPIE
jgi:Response regulator containing CheY-like receiver, AAA-type ATPase, and DNA-binding domains